LHPAKEGKIDARQFNNPRWLDGRTRPRARAQRQGPGLSGSQECEEKTREEAGVTVPAAPANAMGRPEELISQTRHEGRLPAS